MANEPVRGTGGRERLQKIKAMAPKPVKVHAANDTVKRLVRHPHGGAFQADGTAMWPNDKFTARRLRDGDITLDDGGKKPAATHPQPASSH